MISSEGVLIYSLLHCNNLEKNISVKKTKVIQCIDCGEWFEIDINNINVVVKRLKLKVRMIILQNIVISVNI